MVLTLYTGRKSGKYRSENNNEWTVTYSLGGALYNLFCCQPLEEAFLIFVKILRRPPNNSILSDFAWFFPYKRSLIKDWTCSWCSTHAKRAGSGWHVWLYHCDTFVIKSGRGLRIRNLRCLVRRPDHGPGPGLTTDWCQGPESFPSFIMRLTPASSELSL